MNKTYTEKRFFEWHEDDVAVTLRSSGASYGGGSEVLVVQSQFDEVRIYSKEICPTLKAEMGGHTASG